MSTSEAAEAGGVREAELAFRHAAALDLILELRSDLPPDALHAALESHLARALPIAGAATVSYHPATGGQELRAGDDGIDWRVDETELALLAGGELALRPAGSAKLAAVPGLDGAELRGWMVLVFPGDADPREPGALRLLLAAGRLLGLVLGSAAHAEQARIGAEEAEAVDSIARELAESLELEEVSDRVAELAYRVTRKPVVLWLQEGGKIRAVSRTGGALVRLGEERDLPLAGGGGSDFVSEEGSAQSRQSLLLPLAAGSRFVAFMAVGPWSDEPPKPEQFRLLRRLAPHAAAALENARLHAQVRRLSLTDPLVQLPNRRQLDLFLAREFGAAQRGRALCVALYDLDHFKDYNDAHGHRAGDEALVAFADVLRREARAMDLAARYGGEEFAAVLPNTELDGGRAHAERVRRAFWKGSGGQLSVSVGVAAWTKDMVEPGDLMAAADRALYRAKADGRNRVQVAS